MSEYKTYKIITDKEGFSITLHTDLRWTIRLNDIYINPLTDLCIVEYLNVHGKMVTSRFVGTNFNDIVIKEIV